MKLRIIRGEWEIKETDDDEVLANTSFPDRIITINKKHIMTSVATFKHCILHELVHAIQAETGQWQNMSSNGKRKDEFDSEYVAELFALYGEYILELYHIIETFIGTDEGRQNES